MEKSDEGREIRPTVGLATSNTGCRGAKMEAKTQVDGRGDGVVLTLQKSEYILEAAKDLLMDDA